jgi:hypothetical protein
LREPAKTPHQNPESLEGSAAPAFDFDGKIYERINLTNLRSIPLGDRWDGEISIEKNTFTIVTTRKGSRR